MGKLDLKKKARLKRKKRIRKHLVGTQQRPRLNVFRSSKHIYAQVAASSLEKIVKEQPEFKSKVAAADFVGKLIGERAIKKGLKKVVFDRGGFLFHGRVKAVSDGAREAGLDF
jgi:large subunit ribosomal protein L18